MPQLPANIKLKVISGAADNRETKNRAGKSK